MLKERNGLRRRIDPSSVQYFPTRRRRSCGLDRSHELSPGFHRVRARIRGSLRFGYRHTVAASNFFPARCAPRPAFAF